MRGDWVSGRCLVDVVADFSSVVHRQDRSDFCRSVSLGRMEFGGSLGELSTIAGFIHRSRSGDIDNLQDRLACR